jgi:hypothetical protein
MQVHVKNILPRNCFNALKSLSCDFIEILPNIMFSFTYFEVLMPIKKSKKATNMKHSF